MKKNNDIFNKIINKEIVADIIYQDEKVTAFKDLHPQAPVHILIVPNIIIPSANDINKKNKNIIGDMVYTAKKIAKKLGIFQKGYRLIINCNKHGGQEIAHLHLHLLGGRKLGPILSSQFKKQNIKK